MSWITLNDIKPGTVIVVGGRLAIVEEVKRSRPKNPIAYKSNTNHRGYICGLGSVQAVLGDVDLAAWKQEVAPPKPRVQSDRDDSWALPENLRAMNLQVGDTIEIRSRRGVKMATYNGFNANRPKNPVAMTINDRQYKGPASIVLRKIA